MRQKAEIVIEDKRKELEVLKEKIQKISPYSEEHLLLYTNMITIGHEISVLSFMNGVEG